MKRILVAIFFITVQAKVLAFHIVGGEIELIHVQDYLYNLNLLQYFDRSQNINSRPDESVLVYLYLNSDNSLIRTELLTLDSEKAVAYSNPKCAIGSLQTSRIFYTAQITLEPEIFNEEEGYYAVWERCCRNTAVTNIVNPSEVGMTYILDFPPVVKNDVRFINSSPQLFPPLSDYACVNQLYYTNFAGTDPDGDSIVYSLKSPLNSSSPVVIPIPQPKPHSELSYANGSSLENIIPGNPALSISPSGYLTVKPSNAGLFVFSILVEEFRSGEKIGELRRDFQMLVIDGCDPPTPPVAEAKLPGASSFYNEGEIIKYSTAEKKCFEFLVVDNAGESVSLQAVGVNFDGDVSDIFDFDSSPINASGDTLKVEVCISDCPYIQDQNFIIDLIASDDACPLPQRDTVTMTFDVQPPNNNPPTYFDPSSNSVQVRFISEGSMFPTELLEARDLEDSLHFFFYAADFNPVEYGMSLDTVIDVIGRKTVNFNWDTDCKNFSFGQKNHFELGIVLEDYDTCLFDTGDTLFYDLEVVIASNNGPDVYAALSTLNIDAEIKQPFNPFDVFATDADNDSITLKALGYGFVIDSVGADFPETTGIGSTKSNFSWELSCEKLKIKNDKVFKIFFVVEDEDYCKETNQDTLEVFVNMTVPLNNKPLFDITETYQLNINEKFSLRVTASDLDDSDLLSLDLFSKEFIPETETFSFTPVTGNGSVESLLIWTPECSLLGEDRTPKTYTIPLTVVDDNCPSIKADTINLQFEISELTAGYSRFNPPNAFSPNGDGINDTYELSNLFDADQNLPPDNCNDQFQSIIIFDRQGQTIFQSKEREFSWKGIDSDQGTYYYSIDYLNSAYKGIIMLIR